MEKRAQSIKKLWVKSVAGSNKTRFCYCKVSKDSKIFPVCKSQGQSALGCFWLRQMDTAICHIQFVIDQNQFIGCFTVCRLLSGCGWPTFNSLFINSHKLSIACIVIYERDDVKTRIQINSSVHPCSKDYTLLKKIHTLLVFWGFLRPQNPHRPPYNKYK